MNANGRRAVGLLCFDHLDGQALKAATEMRLMDSVMRIPQSAFLIPQ